MTRRTRSILIDSSLPIGRMYTGVSSTANAAANNQIGGAVAFSSVTTIKPQSSAISVANATKGTNFITSGVITEITYSFNGKKSSEASPSGKAVIVRLRKISSTGTTTNLANYTLPVNVLSGTVTANSITITAGDTFYWDVTQVGSTRPGQGLAITMKYFKS
jgi:hypothetical protein